MKALSQNELMALGVMLERAIKHQQLQLGVWVMEKGKSGLEPLQTFATTTLYGIAGNEDSIEVILLPDELKWLWVRYAGYLGGAKKAANRKKRKAR